MAMLNTDCNRKAYLRSPCTMPSSCICLTAVETASHASACCSGGRLPKVHHELSRNSCTCDERAGVNHVKAGLRWSCQVQVLGMCVCWPQTHRSAYGLQEHEACYTS